MLWLIFFNKSNNKLKFSALFSSIVNNNLTISQLVEQGKLGYIEGKLLTNLIGDTFMSFSDGYILYRSKFGPTLTKKEIAIATAYTILGMRIKSYGNERLGNTKFNLDEVLDLKNIFGFVINPSMDYKPSLMHFSVAGIMAKNFHDSGMLEELSRFIYGIDMIPYIDIIDFDPYAENSEQYIAFLDKLEELLTPDISKELSKSSEKYLKLNRSGKYHKYDPLALDLNGDGIQTIASNASAGLFDHDADGIRTAGGWLSGDDGWLVYDRNNNGHIDSGRELFGDNTLLNNGRLAQHGYAALAELDTNADGLINALDAEFSKLQVWQDLNQDGLSQDHELFTLQALGIESLNLNHSETIQDLGNGNRLTHLGHYTKTDGSKGKMGDIDLSADHLHSRYTDTIALTPEQQQNPNLKGSGRLRDLRQAAALSESLNHILRQYQQASSKAEQLALLDDLASNWAATDPRYGSYTPTLSRQVPKVKVAMMAVLP